MKLTAVHTGQCEMSARLFILSCKKGHDSRQIAKFRPCSAYVS